MKNPLFLANSLIFSAFVFSGCAPDKDPDITFQDETITNLGSELVSLKDDALVGPGRVLFSSVIPADKNKATFEITFKLPNSTAAVSLIAFAGDESLDGIEVQMGAPDSALLATVVSSGQSLNLSTVNSFSEVKWNEKIHAFIEIDNSDNSPKVKIWAENDSSENTLTKTSIANTTPQGDSTTLPENETSNLSKGKGKRIGFEFFGESTLIKFKL